MSNYASNAIDLSRLPAPKFTEALSFEGIYAQMLARLIDLHPDFDTSESSIGVKILQVSAYFRLLDRQQLNDDAKSVMVAYATGAALDHLGALLRVKRLPDEKDDPYRERIVLAPDAYSVAGPVEAYIYHARSVSADIRDVSIDSPEPCEIVITVLGWGTDGAVSEEILDQVTDAVSADRVRPLTDLVSVQPATIIEYQIVAEIETYRGPDETVVITAARTRLETYVENEIRLGREITRNGITSALRAEGVHNVTLTQPAADIPAGPYEACVCTDIALTHAGVI
ncbi:MAG: baseplate J/gp47 family protein [Asticcacaulis sp.]